MKTLSLDGLWRFNPELEVRPENNSNLTEGFIYATSDIDRKDWEWGEVPGVWNTYAEKYKIYEGVLWFCKEIELNDIAGFAASRLRFKGVAYKADVFVNGKLAGVHEGAYTEFTIDTTGLFTEGKNLITVRVDNRSTIRKWPCDRGYFGYGGIHRSVSLELLGDNDIDTVALTPVYCMENKTGIIRLSGRILGKKKSSITVDFDGTKTEFTTGEDGSFDNTFEYPSVTPWSPEDTKLYPMTLSTDGYTKSYKIGFKSFESKAGKLYLNGAPYRMKGVCYVYDSPNYGFAMPKSQLEYDLSEMKAAGVNAIRLHWPMSDDFYDLCDEMGFMVWVEPNIYCYHPDESLVGSHFADPVYIENALGMIHEMIAPARSHVSVSFYGIGNECYVQHPEAYPFFEKIAGLVRALDDTRLLAFAALYGLVGKIGDLIDVIGLNSYYGWYDRISDLYKYEPLPCENGYVKYNVPDLTPFHEMLKEVLEIIPKDMPVMLTEFGADSIPGNHSSVADLWSEEYHGEVIEKTIEASYEYDRISGTYAFCFLDNQDPSKSRNGYWNGLNLKGMLTFARDRKQSFYALQRVYSK